MVLVDIRKGKESNSFIPYLALVDLGATYNFVSQAVADSVGMRPAKAGIGCSTGGCRWLSLCTRYNGTRCRWFRFLAFRVTTNGR
jgi:hypothetical protein